LYRPIDNELSPNSSFDPVRSGQDGDVDFVSELLHVEARRSATETVIALESELDLSSTELLGLCVNTVLEKHPESIAIDARGLTFMDSSGLRSLLLARASAREAGVAFRIDNLPPGLLRKFERTGVQTLFGDD
jgi:anti-sigma B factor antagonist